MASKALRKEWSDYFEDEMETAIEKGAMDDILVKMQETLSKRQAYLSTVDSTHEAPASVSDPSKYEPGPIVTDMRGADYPLSASFQFQGRYYYQADLVGQYVKIRMAGVHPRYLSGCTLKVLEFKRKRFSVEVINIPLSVPRNARFAVGDRISCPLTLLDITWR